MEPERPNVLRNKITRYVECAVKGDNAQVVADLIVATFKDALRTDGALEVVTEAIGPDKDGVDWPQFQTHPNYKDRSDIAENVIDKLVDEMAGGGRINA